MTQPAQRRLKAFARRQAVRFRALERSCVRGGKVIAAQVELWGLCRQLAESFERLAKRVIISAAVMLLPLSVYLPQDLHLRRIRHGPNPFIIEEALSSKIRECD